jgi:DNA-directed RNA polymerase subunit M/transcription elongation factor TFIIS
MDFGEQLYEVMAFNDLRKKTIQTLKMFNIPDASTVESVIHSNSIDRNEYMKNFKYLIGSVFEADNKNDKSILNAAKQSKEVSSSYILEQNVEKRLNDIKNKKTDYTLSDVFIDQEQVFRYDINKLLTPVKVVEGLFTCPNCGSTRVQSIEKQTRRADEPPTNFCYCTNCKNRWTE